MCDGGRPVVDHLGCVDQRDQRGQPPRCQAMTGLGGEQFAELAARCSPGGLWQPVRGPCTEWWSLPVPATRQRVPAGGRRTVWLLPGPLRLRQQLDSSADVTGADGGHSRTWPTAAAVTAVPEVPSTTPGSMSKDGTCPAGRAAQNFGASGASSRPSRSAVISAWARLAAPNFS